MFFFYFRSSVLVKSKKTSPEFRMPITQMISPKGVQTRSRRSSMFGVYRKGGIRLIDIPVTPDNKKPSPVKTRRSSVYQKEISSKNNRRSSYAKQQEKPPVRRTRRQNKPQTEIKVDTKKKSSSEQAEMEVVTKPSTDSVLPVVSLVDIVSPKKSHSDSPLLPPKSVKKLNKSISEMDTFKTPKLPSSVTRSNRKSSVKRSARKTSTKKETMPMEGSTPSMTKKETASMEARSTAKKLGIPMEANDSSMLITFKTPAVSTRKSTRKRKTDNEISPPAKKCILDLSPVEKVPFKTPHKLDKSPVLMLTRTPLSDVLTSTPRDQLPLKTPLKPLLSSGKKSLKRPKSTLSKTKKVSIVSELKTPEVRTTRRRGTPAAKVMNENVQSSLQLDDSVEESNNLTILRDSKVFPEPANVTVLSEKPSIVSVNTTSHSSNGRCTIL